MWNRHELTLIGQGHKSSSCSIFDVTITFLKVLELTKSGNDKFKTLKFRLTPPLSGASPNKAICGTSLQLPIEREREREISLWTSKRLQLGHQKWLQSARAQFLAWDTSLSSPLPLFPSSHADIGEMKMDYGAFLAIPWGCTPPCHVTVTIMLLLYHSSSWLALSSLTYI